LAVEPLTAGLGGGDAGLDALADKIALELGEPTAFSLRWALIAIALLSLGLWWIVWLAVSAVA
jgi:hypothetical protein